MTDRPTNLPTDEDGWTFRFIGKFHIQWFKKWGPGIIIICLNLPREQKVVGWFGCMCTYIFIQWWWFWGLTGWWRGWWRGCRGKGRLKGWKYYSDLDYMTLKHLIVWQSTSTSRDTLDLRLSGRGEGGGRQGRDRVIECGNQEELWNNCDAKRDIFEEAGNIHMYLFFSTKLIKN